MHQAQRWEKADLIALALVLANVAAAAAVIWMRCYDPGIDYGRELYVPWRLAEGEILYRDIASLYGPWPVVLHALLFRWTGPSATALAGLNLALLAGFSVLLYGWLRAWCGRGPAVALGVAFVYLFGCANFGATGNYNFLMPYSHEAVHGFYLLALVVACLTPRNGRMTWLRAAGAGWFAGMALFTKVDVLLGVAAALGAALTVRLLSRAWRDAGCLAAAVPGFLLAAMTLPLAASALNLGLDGMTAAWSGSWRLALGPEAGQIGWYRALAGLDRPGLYLMEMGRHAGTTALLVCLLVPACLRGPRGWVRAAAWVLAAGGVVAYFAWRDPMHLGGRILPLLLALTGFAVVLRCVVRGGWNEPGVAALLTAGAGAAGLLAKMGLNPSIYHYGFYLMAPVFLLAALAFLHGLDWARREFPGAVWMWSIDGWRLRSVGGLVLGVYVGLHAVVSLASSLARTGWMDGGPGLRLAWTPGKDTGPWVDAAAAWVSRHVAPEETLAVLPQGVLVNVVSRRANSVPYLHVLGPEVALFGKTKILEAFRNRPPDWIVLLADDRMFLGDPGRRVQDVLPELLEWIRLEYEPAGEIGESPQAPRFASCWKKRREARLALPIP